MKYYYLLATLMGCMQCFGQQTNVSCIPFLDKESQSNVVVAICDLDHGRSCPLKNTNLLSNSDLFTSREQELISGILKKYSRVSRDIPPAGSIISAEYKTNRVVQFDGKTYSISNLIMRCQYTNQSDSHEDIQLGGGILAKYRDNSGNGYDVSITRCGSGSMLTFLEQRENQADGIFVRLMDMHGQSLRWDYRLAEFGHAPVTEYRHYHNGMVIGKWIMWNEINNNILIEANFKEPFDFEKHRVDLSRRQ